LHILHQHSAICTAAAALTVRYADTAMRSGLVACAQ